jgi:hypothetical protein
MSDHIRLARNAGHEVPATPPAIPEPTPAAKPVALPPSTFIKDNSTLKPSSLRDILPAFSNQGLLAAKQQEQREKESAKLFKETFGPSPIERARIHAEMLAEQVRANEITNEQANKLYAAANHPVPPDQLK